MLKSKNTESSHTSYLMLLAEICIFLPMKNPLFAKCSKVWAWECNEVAYGLVDGTPS